MTDERLRHDVEDELFWDPKVDSDSIVVSARDGMITLRGTVGSFQAKRDATKDAQCVYGVSDVRNELEVNLPGEARRADADLRGAVLQALALDSLVPASVAATAADGWVTLTGTASWQYQRDEAETCAGNIAGVVGVTNDIKLVAVAPTAADVRQSITEAMQRNARIDAGRISVDTGDGTVILRGSVGSWADHDEAIRAAWRAPGVTRVVDDLQVAY